MRREPQTPGELTALNNAAEDPNEVARSRERVLQATAVAATGGEGEIAPGPDIDDGPALRTATVHGEGVRVRIAPSRRDPLSAKYGPESKLAKGTHVNADGTVFEGQGQAYGVIGDYLDPQKGWLINRIIPLDSLDADTMAA